ncbi:MAG: PKD domain-containing protein [candidate division Zixibacteria bacterium]|nr:PKD domain-containing protein [candidate division Zixibacteria bacterium]
MNRIKGLALTVGMAATLVYLVPGCDDLITETNNYIIAGHPEAEFSANKDGGCVPCTVQFSDNSQGPYQRGTFNFGDDTPDSESTFDPDSTGTFTHIYEEGGTYTVSLTVFDETLPDTGQDTETKSRFLIIGPLSAAFDTDTTMGCRGLEVTFTNISQAGITKWVWSFGDGAGITYNDSTPDTITHTYTMIDTLQVTLTVTGECGTTTGIDTITIIDCLTPVCSLSVHEGCIPLSVDFWDMTDPTVAFRSWDFGNGETSILMDNTIEYDSAGIYVIALGISDNENGPFGYVYDTVIVHDTVTALFTVIGDSTSCHLPGRQFQVRFLDQSLGQISHLVWDFGDGDTLHDDTNPIHAYTEPGVYDVSLIVEGMCDSTLISDTSIIPNLVVLFDSLTEANTALGFVPSTGDTSTVFTFAVDTTRAVIETWTWTVDTLTIENAWSVIYSFPDTGWHAVSVTVTNGCGSFTIDSSIYIDTMATP